MTYTTRSQRQTDGPYVDDRDDCTHYNISGAQEASSQGRLVLVLEHELSEASRTSLHKVLKNIMPHDDITMISGLSRASMLQAEQMGSGLFYNRKEYLSPEKAFRMLPWREIWLIAGGRVWTLLPTASA